jgi:hypothetical protein
MNLDLALLLASIVFTILLAAVGVEMANSPPTSRAARWIYRSVFIVLGGLLVGTTYWQGKRNIDEQNKLKTAAETQEKKLDDRYGEIKSQYDRLDGKLGTIKSFAKNPPSGLSPQQVNEAIRAMAGTGNLKQRANALAKEIADNVAYRIEIADPSHLKQKPTPEETVERQKQLLSSISMNFRLGYLKRVKEIRDEFAQFHILNKDLDDFLKYEQMEIESQQNAQLWRVISQYEIERVENELRDMANQLKD